MAALAAIITKHFEYVAQLEAQLHGSPYYDFAVRTVALAKRALETDLVRLDETPEETATDTWTSHIKTLEWLVKFPTMSLTFETFKTVLEHVELVQLFLTLTDIDPSAEENYAICWASQNGHTDVVKVLLANERVDPTANNNCAICWASQNGHTEVVKVLLADPHVNPSADDNYAIQWASRFGHVDVVKVLLADPRVNPSADYNFATRVASFYGHTEIVKMLRVNVRNKN